MNLGAKSHGKASRGRAGLPPRLDFDEATPKRSSVFRTVLCRCGIDKKPMVLRRILRSSFHLLSMLNRP